MVGLGYEDMLNKLIPILVIAVFTYIIVAPIINKFTKSKSILPSADSITEGNIEYNE